MVNAHQAPIFLQPMAALLTAQWLIITITYPVAFMIDSLTEQLAIT